MRAPSHSAAAVALLSATLLPRLGVPEGSVKSRTHYALRALKLALEEMGIGA